MNLKLDLHVFVNGHMKKGGRLVAARLQTALALLEKLRTAPSLSLADHLASPGSSGLKSHETYGREAHKRLALKPINKNHGRRSSSLQDWGQELLEALRRSGFVETNPRARTRLIYTAQKFLGNELRAILDQDPMRVAVGTRTAEAVIGDLLTQAGVKNKTGDVAQYLVGAKLMLRFDITIPVHAANKPDRTSRSDSTPRLGDFEFNDAVIEVAVGPPDEKHIQQVAEILEDTTAEVWLLTRADRAAAWRNELENCNEIEMRRVVVASVEAFVGQNITELGGFSTASKANQLQALFAIYNSRWVEEVGTPGIRIEVK